MTESDINSGGLTGRAERYAGRYQDEACQAAAIELLLRRSRVTAA